MSAGSTKKRHVRKILASEGMPRKKLFACEPTLLGAGSGDPDSNYTRERRRPLFRVYFTGFRFGSIFVRPVPLFTSII